MPNVRVFQMLSIMRINGGNSDAFVPRGIQMHAGIIGLTANALIRQSSLIVD